MAKRYGRNQRRQHREKIEQLEQANERLKQELENAYGAVEMAKGLTEWYSAKLGELRTRVDEWDADTARLLGAYSAFLIETATMKESGPLWRLPLFQRISSSPIDWNVPLEKNALVDRVDLLHQLARVDYDHHNLRLIVRVLQLKGPGEREYLHLAYNIGDRALMRMGKRDRRRLAADIAEQFEAKANEVPHG